MEKLNNLKPLISCNEELYISKEAKKENALASEGKSCRPEKINMRVTTFQHELYFNKPPKFTFAQSKRFPPKHNLPNKENNSSEEAIEDCVAFFYEEGKGGENFRKKNKFRCKTNVFILKTWY